MQRCTGTKERGNTDSAQHQAHTAHGPTRNEACEELQIDAGFGGIQHTLNDTESCSCQFRLAKGRVPVSCCCMALGMVGLNTTYRLKRRQPQQAFAHAGNHFRWK